MDLFVMKKAVGILYEAVMNDGHGNRDNIRSLCVRYADSLTDVTSEQRDKILEQCYKTLDKTA